MEYKEYGSKNNDIIILLHGGGLSWWNYIDEISLLENEFHIVIPILDGHSGSNTNFTSIESNALEIINFINKNYNGKVKLIRHQYPAHLFQVIEGVPRGEVGVAVRVISP